MKTFLIAPVRALDADFYKRVVCALEEEGWVVHWPARDTVQDDATGLSICRQNASAIASVDVVHIVWDGLSQGCLFDLGVAFALDKAVKIISLPEFSSGKSFQNMIRAWAEETTGSN